MLQSQQEASQSNMICVTEYSVPLLLQKSVPLLVAVQVLSITIVQMGKYKGSCLVDGEEEESPSGSFSNVVTQEDDVVGDDGGGLTSDLVLVHILSVVQFPLHYNPGPFLDVLVGHVSQTRFEHRHTMPRRLLTDVTW